MLTNHPPRGMRHAAFLMAAAGIGAMTATGVADAHFVLMAPTNWMMQDATGLPQKLGPCGNEAPQTPTNVVTPFRPGQVVTIQLTQTVPHPGHYRVALATSQNQLPPEPVVAPSAQDPCASAAVSPNTFPILVDGALDHTGPLNGVQTIQVTLPTNVTCTNCYLQVIEFMSSHTAPCFYHHCATISIQGAPVDGGTTVDAGRGTSTGTAGANGAGGAPGTGGSPAGGVGTGGSPGTGGSGVTGTAGSANGTTGATGSGGTPGGGTDPTTGSTTTNGSTGSGGASRNAPADTANGCACSVPGSASRSLAGLASVAALAFAIRGRRRRR